MYEPFFGFHRRPFSTAPDPGCFFAGESVQGVLTELTTCVERGQGIALLTAPAGMGKSLLCQRLIGNLKGQFATIYLGNANFPTRRSLLQAILLELGDEYSRSDEAELRHTLQKRLHGLRRQHEALLLVVDEAHLFESDLLEEIRTLADIAAEGQPLVRIVLSGQLELEERLTDRRFDALNQRLGTHVYLEPLTQSESAEYLHHRIEQAGGEAENVFTEDGFSIIVRASGGVPRCLNQLADHALLLAFAADEKPVNEKTVRDALDDLKQLPLHWNDVSDSVSSGTFAPAADLSETDEFDFATADVSGDAGFPEVAPEFADEPAGAEFSFDGEPGDGATAEDAEPESNSGNFAALPVNAATLAAAADAFDAVSESEPTNEFADEFIESECSMLPAEESSFEASWEEAYVKDESQSDNATTLHSASADPVAADPIAADDPWLAGSDSGEHGAEPAVLEFGAESDFESTTLSDATPSPSAFDTTFDNQPKESLEAAELPVPTDSIVPETNKSVTAAADREPQPATQQSPGETSVQATLAPATGVVETFVVDPYSTLEEPLSADIVWPKSAYFQQQAEAEPQEALADISEAGVETDSFSDAECNVAEAEPEVEPQTEVRFVESSDQKSVFEFSATDESIENKTDVTAEAVEPVADEAATDAEPAVSHESDGDTRVLPERQALETMFEFGVDPQSDTGLESDIASQTTFEQAESLLSEFGGSRNQEDAVPAEGAIQAPLDAESQTDAECQADTEPSTAEEAHSVEPSQIEAAVDAEPDDELVAAEYSDEFARNVDPPQAITTIDAMLSELSYAADDVGQAVNDRSDEPERTSIEIESELLRTLDHSAAAERDIEDEIGATMLDICLDTQSAIYEMTRQLRDSSATADVVEEQAEEDLPHIADVDPSIFDIVEPETRSSNSVERPQPEQQTQAASVSPPSKKRAFGTLFSDLRRRKQ